jgi:hypothetical protein
VNAVARWLACRRPTAPADLAASLDVRETGAALDADLVVAALERLAAARAELGRVRTSAFRLLEADALITYACEAAVEGDDPEGALRRILAATSG